MLPAEAHRAKLFLGDMTELVLFVGVPPLMIGIGMIALGILLLRKGKEE